MNFNELSIHPTLIKNCEKMGYKSATPIQEKAIPSVLKGRDLLGLAQTGTGKTAAFALPILNQLMNRRRTPGIKALVLTPTRELALQIMENFQAYSQGLPLRTVVIFGGVKQGSQVNQLKRGADVLIATPGRLLDLVQQRLLDLSQVDIFVLDEADRMLDMGFVNDVKKISALVKKQRQTLLFSATMPKEIVGLANSLLQNPVKVEATPVSTPIEKIEQSVYFVEKRGKDGLLLKLIEEQNMFSVLVFTRTKHEADKVVKSLAFGKIKAMAIHGNKSQNARQRALSAFKSHEIQVLVATDIAARGIDIEKLSHVINYNIPNISETYVHRIGRTARAGQEGVAISFCQSDERPFLKDVEKLIKYSIPKVETPVQFIAPVEVNEKPKRSNQQRNKRSTNQGRGQRKENRSSAYGR